MNELRDVKLYKRLTLDKLPKIMGDFFRLDDEWQELDFLKLAGLLRNRTDPNLKTLHNSDKHEKYKCENIFQIKKRECKTHESNAKTSACQFVRYQDIKSVSVGQSIGRSNVE